MPIKDIVIFLFKINHLILIYIEIGIHLDKDLIKSFNDSLVSVFILGFLFN